MAANCLPWICNPLVWCLSSSGTFSLRCEKNETSEGATFCLLLLLTSATLPPLPAEKGNVGFRHREIPRASLLGDQISVILPIARVSEAREREILLLLPTPFGTMYFRQVVYKGLCTNYVCTEVVCKGGGPKLTMVA